MLLGAAMLLLALGVFLGWGRGTPERAERWAIRLAVATIALVLAEFWAYDQGGILWLLLIPLAFVGVVLVAIAIVGIGFTAGGLVQQRRALSWRHGRPFVVYAVLFMLLWGIFQVAPLISRVSERAMMANFHRHEREFWRLAEMAEEDRRFMRIAPDFVSPPPPAVGAPSGASVEPLSERRWNEYRALFRTTDLRNGTTHRGSSIWFDYWMAGFLDGAEYQGYAYSTHPPSPIVDSIEAARRSGERGRPVYQPIGDNWYLYWFE